METETNPVEVEDSPIEGTEAEAQEVEQQDEVELDEEGNPIEREPEDEEIDLDDLKLKVPKDQAQKVREALLRQADYTRKTQELADGRKAFDAERQSFQQATQAELATAGQLSVYDQQLAQYARIDWQQWQYEDPDAAQASFMAYQQLKDARTNAFDQLSHLRTQRVSAAQQETAKRVEQTKAALAKDIPDWSPALEAQVADFGMKEFGFTADEMADMKIDPRIAKAFHRLHTLEAQAKKTAKAQGHVAAQAVKPAARAGGGSSAPPTGLDDRLSTDEWMKRRNAQERKRA